MAKLTTKQRKKLPSSKFALPAERKYPVDTKARAANAKARATQMVDKGELSKAKKEKIDAAANKVLKKDKAKPSVKKPSTKKTTTKKVSSVRKRSVPASKAKPKKR